MSSFCLVHPSRSDSEILWLYQVWPLYHRLSGEGLPSHRQRRQQWAQLPRQAAQRADEGGELQGHAHEVLARHVFCKWKCVCVSVCEREGIHLQACSVIIKLGSLHSIRRLWAGRVRDAAAVAQSQSQTNKGFLCFQCGCLQTSSHHCTRNKCLKTCRALVLTPAARLKCWPPHRPSSSVQLAEDSAHAKIVLHWSSSLTHRAASCLWTDNYLLQRSESDGTQYEEASIKALDASLQSYRLQ